MMADIMPFRPPGAVARIWGRLMDVILHIGVHRTATTSFQHYLRHHAAPLTASGVAYWGPHRTRQGLFSGILPDPMQPGRRDALSRARGRILLNIDRNERQGRDMLLVSDENMSGTVRENLRLGALYVGIGDRVARYCAAFGGRVTQVVVSVRSLDTYWASALAFGLTRGAGVPGLSRRNRLAYGERGWRDVITDLAEAVPGVPLRVVRFEDTGGRADAAFTAITGRTAPLGGGDLHRNRAPDLAELRAVTGGDGLPAGSGAWQPFDHWQRIAMQRKYQEDLAWLADGADGLAELARQSNKDGQTQCLRQTDGTRGRSHDIPQRRMAGARDG